MKRDRRGTLRETLQDLKTMTPKERLSHIWSYYYLWIIGFVILIIFFVEVGKIIANARYEVVASGLLLNMEVPDDMHTCLEEDFVTYIGGDPKKQKAETASQYYGYSDDTEYSYYAAISVMAWISAGELDYMISDEVGFEKLAGNDVFLDLHTFFTEEELAGFGDRLLYDAAEDGETYPVGISLTGTDFAERYLTGDYYLCFFANCEAVEHMPQLCEYLGV